MEPDEVEDIMSLTMSEYRAIKDDPTWAEKVAAFRDGIAAVARPNFVDQLVDLRAMRTVAVKRLFDAPAIKVFFPITQAVIEPLVAPEVKSVMAGLAPQMAAIQKQAFGAVTTFAKANAGLMSQLVRGARAIAHLPGAEFFGKCLFQDVLKFLEKIPGTKWLRGAVRALRDCFWPTPTFYLLTTLRSAPEQLARSRFNSPSRLVRYTPGRTLRGPSISTAIRLCPRGAAA